MAVVEAIERLKGIREPTLRRQVLARELASGDPDAWIEILAGLLARAVTTDDITAAAAVEALTHAVADPALTYEARQALYEAARRRRHGPLARLFLDASPATALAGVVARQMSPERPLRPQGRPLTLGERKALARTHRRDFITLLVKDPHPDVVAVLLGNPHLTEDDVVRMAAIRPALPAALTVIAAHPRWSARHPVRRALVLNPGTPLHVAVRLATTLRPGELAALAADPTMPLPLREHAAELLASVEEDGSSGGA